MTTFIVLRPLCGPVPGVPRLSVPAPAASPCGVRWPHGEIPRHPSRLFHREGNPVVFLVVLRSCSTSQKLEPIDNNRRTGSRTGLRLPFHDMFFRHDTSFLEVAFRLFVGFRDKCFAVAVQCGDTVFDDFLRFHVVFLGKNPCRHSHSTAIIEKNNAKSCGKITFCRQIVLTRTFCRHIIRNIERRFAFVNKNGTPSRGKASKTRCLASSDGRGNRGGGRGEGEGQEARTQPVSVGFSKICRIGEKTGRQEVKNGVDCSPGKVTINA